MIYSCGCENEIDPDSGVLHCIKKCPFHIEFLKNQDHNSVNYYNELGSLKDGIPQNRQYINELLQAAGDLHAQAFLANGNGRDMLEIGCGLGQYIPLFLNFGWHYEAVELSTFAANWVTNTFDVVVENYSFNDFVPIYDYNLILAIHVLEHMPDVVEQLHRIRDMLLPKGCLFLLVPDDTDKTNPDHWYFFTEPTLRSLLEKVGFKNIRTTTRQIVEREKYIYCFAEK